MASGKIYLRSGKSLIAMTEVEYELEDHIQTLLADHPDLLAGDQIRPDAPRRWILVERESGIEDSSGGLRRWSLDHLFLDQDAIPTLVEVKRSSDTRIRREVIGQLLEYAANIAAYWPPGSLRLRFEGRLDRMGRDPDKEVLELIEGGEIGSVAAFWDLADQNLAARRLRLIIAADQIPPELLRIIEFLNENFRFAEVLAVELRQFRGEDHQTLVPRVLGRSETAEQLRHPSKSAERAVRHWTLGEFLAAAESAGGPLAVRLTTEAARWIERHGQEPILGHGKFGPLYLTAGSQDGAVAKIANVSAWGGTMINFESLATTRPFDRVEERLELSRRLNAIPGVLIDDRYPREATWPMIRPEALQSDEAIAGFYDAMDWVAARLTGGESPIG